MRIHLFLRAVAFLALAVVVVQTVNAVDECVIAIATTNSEVRVSTTTTGYVGRIHVVEVTTDLVNGEWIPIHALSNDVAGFLDPDADLHGARWFRSVLTEPPLIAPSFDVKNDIDLTQQGLDWFLSDPINDDYHPDGGQPVLNPNKQQWVKFHVLFDDLTRTYYQNQQTYDFHYNFAIAELDPYFGMSHSDYMAETLYRSNQSAVVGTVIVAPNVNEYAVQFVAADELPRELVRFLYETVDASIVKPPEYTGFYMPTLEQAGLADAERTYFENAGITIISADRWSAAEGRYADGWALGRLVYVEATNLQAAYASGALLPTDILLIDEVPAEVPYVAGIISLAAATPNSHVAILAESYGIPFVYVADSNTVASLYAAVGNDVVLRAVGDTELKIVDVSGTPSTLKDEILEMKAVPPLAVTPKETFGAYSTNVDELVPADIKHFGGKASNYGFLRRTVSNNCRIAMAFSFDLWDDYMDQLVDGTNSMRNVIANMLAGYTYPPADMQQLEADLDTVRDLIKDGTFTSAQSNAILTALSNMFTNMDRNIRFRSSTNVEDSENFAGAGLYDSYSGCLMDDLDGDDVGPSYCDTNEPNERGVFRAIRKVYASFYNDNAFLERLRRSVNETDVGMAILVHYNFPDEDELANSVATCVFTIPEPRHRLATSMVSQPGEASVTNPDGTELPEIVTIEEYRYGFLYTNLTFEQKSELLDIGETYVMDWEQDYRDFGVMFFDVAEGFYDYYSRTFSLDFECKKMVPGDLIIKQVRELPASPEDTNTTAVILNEPGSWNVFQCETWDMNGGLFANHRLKSIWQFATDERWLDGPGRSNSIFTAGEWEFLLDGSNTTWTGTTSNWPAYQHSVSEEAGFFASYTLTDSWEVASAMGTITYSLAVTVPQVSNSAWAGPLMVLDDLNMQLTAVYPEYQTCGLEWDGGTRTTLIDVVTLESYDDSPELPEGALLQERLIETNGVSLQIDFYWPMQPIEGLHDYTAWLLRWDETTITGLTTNPIVLHGDYSQSYNPARHNMSEQFLFEPQLEPGMSGDILEELQAADIRMIYADTGLWGECPIKLVGFDGMIREMP